MSFTLVGVTADEAVDEGSEAAEVDAFVRHGYPQLVAALALASRSRVAAEDAVQEALARALLRHRTGDRIENLDAWVRVVAMNLLRNRWRSLVREGGARRRLAGELRRVGEGTGVGVEELIDLDRAIGQLSHRQREAVALYYRLGLTATETAAAMGVTEGTVKTLLHRARAVLAEGLGQGRELDHD